MNETEKNYLEFKKTLAPEVRLVAISKTKPEEEIMALYNLGHRIFGENKVQELCRKAENLPEDIEWHLVGHLQSNKVKYIAPFVHCIHAVDSLKLLNVIEKEASKNNRIIHCLLQLYIASEETKFGLSEDELYKLVNEIVANPPGHVRVTGLMGMASFTEDSDQVRSEFKKLKTIFEDLKSGLFRENGFFRELSMGMSGDYKIAIEEGSNMIRIGSLIFGERNYS